MRVQRLIPLALLVSVSAFAAAPDMPEAGDIEADAIIERYRTATEAQKDQLRGVQMEVDIEAAIPKLQKKGRLHALRQISKLGRITYQMLGFDGDNTIKKELIARYLAAETDPGQQTAPPITPENYKFKYKGIVERNNQIVHLIQVSPKKKAVGLFKGELWLDQTTYLPVREAGRMVKNPSVFIKKFEFTRDFEIKNGLSIPRHTEGFVETRLWGRAQLSIDFSNFSRQDAEQAQLVASPAGQQ